MLKRTREILDKATNYFTKKSLQFTISIMFTAVAVFGMLIIGATLYFRFMSTSEEMISKDSTRMVDQVNINMDTYLRNMMRISDSMYYRVIKNADLETDDIGNDMSLLYETNRDLLISIGVFSNEGNVIAAEPLAQVKPTADIKEQMWFKNAARKIENCHFSTPQIGRASCRERV